MSPLLSNIMLNKLDKELEARGLHEMQRGLIEKDSATLSDDGTCVHTHARPYGHKVCGCADNGESRCDCPRHYSDLDAH